MSSNLPPGCTSPDGGGSMSELSPRSPEPWHQGRLLDTAQTRLWTPERRATVDQQERRMFFRGFTSEDQGRSREHIGHCRYADDVLRIVACVNAMAGIPDPAALVESHTELLNWVRSTEAVREKMNGPPSDVLVQMIARAEAARGN